MVRGRYPLVCAGPEDPVKDQENDHRAESLLLLVDHLDLCATKTGTILFK
jgi:hypothetical protein